MDVQHALLSRRTIHAYRRDPIPDGAVEAALLAAHHAPCHRLTWPWRFVVMGRDTRRLLLPRYLALKTAGREPSDALREALIGKLLDPPVVVVPLLRRCDDLFRAREDYAAIACAIQNLQLSVTATGLGAKWSTGAITRDPGTYAVLGVDPALDEIVGWVWVGWPAKVPQIERPALAERVRTLP